MDFRSALAPLKGLSDTKATRGRALAIAWGLEAHLAGVIVRPNPEEVFGNSGLGLADHNIAIKGVRCTVDEHRKSLHQAAVFGGLSRFVIRRSKALVLLVH